MSQEVLEVVQKNQFMDFVVPKIIAVRSVSLLKIDWLKTQNGKPWSKIWSEVKGLKYFRW